ncbi:1-aminocyclopropane-1-carboxylate deaminase, partial [Kaistia algarum]
WQITDQYCCGGYAKTTPELLQFIQDFEQCYQIPLEQIYTGKMLLGLSDLIQQGSFPKDHRILVIHSGGLQGRLAAL